MCAPDLLFRGSIVPRICLFFATPEKCVISSASRDPDGQFHLAITISAVPSGSRTRRMAPRGQWRAHGRYIARETASQGRATEAGFNTTERGIDIADRLGPWQSASDERMWKLIVSPEFGDRMDLVQLTRDLMQRMERDLGTRLEWLAASHFNTDNRHVHVARVPCVRMEGHSVSNAITYSTHLLRIFVNARARVSNIVGHRGSPAPRSVTTEVHVAGSGHWPG